MFLEITRESWTGVHISVYNTPMDKQFTTLIKSSFRKRVDSFNSLKTMFRKGFSIISVQNVLFIW